MFPFRLPCAPINCDNRLVHYCFTGAILAQDLNERQRTAVASGHQPAFRAGRYANSTIPNPSGAPGMSFPGHFGTGGTTGIGVGGGLDLMTGGTVVIDNTTITGNNATTTDNDVHGTFSV
jgi:hypothetical protein